MESEFDTLFLMKRREDLTLYPHGARTDSQVYRPQQSPSDRPLLPAAGKLDLGLGERMVKQCTVGNMMTERSL